MRKFDELSVGETRQSEFVELTEHAIRAFAEQFDPQWFHIDPHAAKASPFGGLVASGAHLISLWRRIDHAINGDIAYQCGVGMENVKFVRAVSAGERLRLRSEIVAMRPSSTQAERGLVTMAYLMSNQDGQTVMTLTALNLVYR